MERTFLLIWNLHDLIATIYIGMIFWRNALLKHYPDLRLQIQNVYFQDYTFLIKNIFAQFQTWLGSTRPRFVVLPGRRPLGACQMITPHPGSLPGSGPTDFPCSKCLVTHQITTPGPDPLRLLACTLPWPQAALRPSDHYTWPQSPPWLQSCRLPRP